MSFTITLSTVAMMLLYAVPGYLMTKAKLLREEAIAPLVTLLLYLCSPMQTMYTMQGVTYSAYMLKYLGIATVLSIGLVALMLGIVYACLRRRQDVVAFRISPSPRPAATWATSAYPCWRRCCRTIPRRWRSRRCFR